MCQKMYAKGTGRCVIIHIEFYSGELIMIRKEQLRLYAITDKSWLKCIKKWSNIFTIKRKKCIA